MKIRDLIAALQEHDPDETVFAYREDRVRMGFVKLDRMSSFRYNQSGELASHNEPMLVIYGLYVEDIPNRDIYDSAGLILRRSEKPASRLERKPVSKRNKRRRWYPIAYRPNHCHWCNAPFNEADPDSTRYPTRDHRIPKSRGGGTGLDGNLVWACRECNMLKADLMPDEFVEYLKITNDGVRHAVAYGLARNGVRYEEWRCGSR